MGVLGFAVATGLLFGRVSRPSAKIGFSQTMVITPYQEEQSLQFRVVNRRRNDLMEIQARVLIMTVEDETGSRRGVIRNSSWNVNRCCSCRSHGRSCTRSMEKARCTG